MYCPCLKSYPDKHYCYRWGWPSTSSSPYSFSPGDLIHSVNLKSFLDANLFTLLALDLQIEPSYFTCHLGNLTGILNSRYLKQYLLPSSLCHESSPCWNHFCVSDEHSAAAAAWSWVETSFIPSSPPSPTFHPSGTPVSCASKVGLQHVLLPLSLVSPLGAGPSLHPWHCANLLLLWSPAARVICPIQNCQSLMETLSDFSALRITSTLP